MIQLIFSVLFELQNNFFLFLDNFKACSSYWFMLQTLLLFYSYRTAALAKYLYENMQIGWFSFAEIANKTGMMKEDIIPTLVNMGIIPKRKGRPITENKLRRIVEGLKPKFERKRWISMDRLDFVNTPYIDVHPTKKLKDAPKNVLNIIEQVSH